jgi:hypothetical protein
MNLSIRKVIVSVVTLYFVSIQGLLALPGSVGKIESVVGSVIEVHNPTKENPWLVVRLKVTNSSSQDKVKALYSITRKARKFPVRIENYGRPGKDEVLLVFEAGFSKVPEAFSRLPTKGDVLRVTGYHIGVFETNSGYFTSPGVDKVEINPKN